GTIEYDPAVLGAFDFLPEGDFTTDEIEIVFFDGNGGFATVTATIEIDGVNDAPDVFDEVFLQVNENDPAINIDLLENSFDEDGDPLFIDFFSQVAGPDVLGIDDFGVYRFQGAFLEASGGFVSGVGDVTGDGVEDYAVRADISAGAGGIAVLFEGGGDALNSLDLADGVADGNIDLNLAGTGGAGLSPLFSQTLTGAELLSDPNIQFFGSNPTVTGTALELTSGGGAPLMMDWDLLAPDMRGALAVNITIDYEPLTGDNDMTFGLTDGVDFAGWERSDNSGGSWFSRQGDFGPNAPGFAQQQTGLGAFEPFTMQYLLRDEEAGSFMTITEGADTFEDFSYSAILDTDADLSFALFGNSSGERYLINSISIEVLGVADAAIGTVDGDVASAIGDVTGDGVDDLAFGNFEAGVGGEVYLVPGGSKLSGFGGRFERDAIDGTNGFIIGGSNAGDELQAMVTQALGDVDGDGIGDFLLGAPGFDVGALEDAGAAYIISGADVPAAADSSGFVDVDSLIGLSSYRLKGDSSLFDRGVVFGGELGADLAAGDIDGDGVADILVGAPGADAGTGSPNKGEAYIVFGGATNFETLDAADAADDNVLTLAGLDGDTGFRLIGPRGELDQATGLAITVIGDVDGDGIDDFVVAAPQPNLDASGQAFLVFGGRDNLAALDAFDGDADGLIDLLN
ncbi:MAG: hypothetical protein AAFP78_06635, partial [Pseudomonadota bacterium]